MELNGFTGSYICACEASGLAKCFEAYAENCAGESIFEIGFNPNSGYTYIALEENCISICSHMGDRVSYLVTDFDNGNETFYDNYTLAMQAISEII